MLLLFISFNFIAGVDLAESEMNCFNFYFQMNYCHTNYYYYILCTIKFHFFFSMRSWNCLKVLIDYSFFFSCEKLNQFFVHFFVQGGNCKLNKKIRLCWQGEMNYFSKRL